jgi:heat shock protein HslJ
MIRVLLILILMLLSFSCVNRKIAKNVAEEGNDRELLSGDQWKLAALENDTFFKTRENRAYIIFDTENKTVSGNSGCNTFFGKLTLNGENGMLISDVTATKMACEDMTAEHRLLSVFRETRELVLKNDTLMLCSADSTVLAKFVR